MLTAVDRDVGPGHEGCLIRGEIGNQPAISSGLPRRLIGNMGQDLGFEGLPAGIARPSWCRCSPGDGVDGHAGLGHFEASDLVKPCMPALAAA